MNPTLVLENKDATLGEILQEAELFEYSKTYQALFKEGLELTLMEMYMDTQAFLMENTGVLTEETISTLMVESTTTDSIENILTMYAEKAGKFMANVKTLGARVWKSIKAFLGRILNVFTNSQGKRIEELQTKLGEAETKLGEAESKIKTMAKAALGKDKGLSEREGRIKVLKAKVEGLQRFKTIIDDCSDAELRQILTFHKDILQDEVQLVAHPLVHDFDDFFTGAVAALEGYAANPGKSSSKIKKLGASLASQLDPGASKTALFRMKDIDRIHKIFQDREAAWNEALSKISESARGASDVAATKKGKTAEKVGKGQEETKLAGGAGVMVTAPPTGINAMVLDLVTKLQKAMVIVMSELKEYSDQRERSLRVWTAVHAELISRKRAA